LMMVDNNFSLFQIQKDQMKMTDNRCSNLIQKVLLTADSYSLPIQYLKVQMKTTDSDLNLQKVQLMTGS
jgi:hypothetical protein